MSETRTLRTLAIAFAVACLAWAGVTMAVAPAASADNLGNGYVVSCTKANDNQVTCNISGCPRVHEDLAGDVVHTKVNGGPQNQLNKSCGNTTTERINASSNFTYSVQGCRTGFSDDCGAWSDYQYVAPVVAPPPPPPPVKCDDGSTVPAGQQCPVKPVAKPDVVCPDGSPTKTVPAGQQCAPIPDVTNAIQASFGDPGLSSIDFNVTNTSNITATCNYTATANSLNPLVPKKTTRQFNVPANGNHTESFNGAPTLTSYNVTLSCKDASGKQKAELGHVNTSVLW